MVLQKCLGSDGIQTHAPEDYSKGAKLYTAVTKRIQWCALENQQSPFYEGLDLLMLKIWGLQIKGLQSYWPSNFALAHSSAFTAEECAIAFGPDSSEPGVESFSKSDGLELCSPLTYRPQILII